MESAARRTAARSPGAAGGPRRTRRRPTPLRKRGRVKIRKLGARDAGWVVRSADLFDEPVDRSAAASYLKDPANVFFLAVGGGVAVGFLRGTALRQPHTARRQMLLYEVGVRPAERRRGVGSGLVRALLEHCRRASFEEIFVFTSPNNRAAVRLYRSTGAVTETSADRMFVYRLGRDGPPPRA